MVSYKQLISGINLKPPIGFFGYSSIVLIKSGQDVILSDVGGPGVREFLIDLKKKEKITKIFISHLHLDHCANIDLFLNIPVLFHKDELRYVLKSDMESYGLVKIVMDNFLKNGKPELFDRDCNLTKEIRIVRTPGHTIANSSLMFQHDSKAVIVAGDAVETYREYQDTGTNASCFNVKKYRESKKYIKDNFDIIIPGHGKIFQKNLTNNNNTKVFLAYF